MATEDVYIYICTYIMSKNSFFLYNENNFKSNLQPGHNKRTKNADSNECIIFEEYGKQKISDNEFWCFGCALYYKLVFRMFL